MATISDGELMHFLKDVLEPFIRNRLPPGVPAGPYVTMRVRELAADDYAAIREGSIRAAKRDTLRLLVPRWQAAYDDPDERAGGLRSLLKGHARGRVNGVGVDPAAHRRLVESTYRRADLDYPGADENLYQWVYLMHRFRRFTRAQVGAVLGLPENDVELLSHEILRRVELVPGRRPVAKGTL